MATEVFKQILMVYSIIFMHHVHIKLLSYLMNFIVICFFITIGDTKLEANVYCF